MKFKEFVENVNLILKKYPKIGEFEALISYSDFRSNGYDSISTFPAIGVYNSEDEEFKVAFTQDVADVSNAVCVNGCFEEVIYGDGE
jgi:hypothetical protein